MSYLCKDHPENRQFVAGATVNHEWLVDENGEFIRDLGALDSEMYDDDIWCAICGELAIWIEGEDK